MQLRAAEELGGLEGTLRLKLTLTIQVKDSAESAESCDNSAPGQTMSKAHQNPHHQLATCPGAVGTNPPLYAEPRALRKRVVQVFGAAHFLASETPKR